MGEAYYDAVVPKNPSLRLQPHVEREDYRMGAEDRPQVIPKGAENFAFLSQFVEISEDTGFTVEYSAHGAMRAVYEMFGFEKEIPQFAMA